MRNESPSNILVLLSGGVDSSALLHYHTSQGHHVDALFIDYGQPNIERELMSAKKVSDYYCVHLYQIKLGFTLNNFNGEYFCRNALFVLAAYNLSTTFSMISLGIHSGTPYYDSSVTFINDMQELLNGYFGGTVRLIAPFINYSKKQVFEYVISNQVPFQMTYSCEIGLKEPCRKCPSCIDRRLLDDSSSS